MSLKDTSTQQRINCGLAIDPGGRAKGNAVSLFAESSLFRTDMVRDFPGYIHALSSSYNVHSMLVEMPVVRQTGQQKGRQSDIVDLAVEVGRVIATVAQYFPDCIILTVKPEEWKRNIPKTIGCKRILERLTEEEKSVLPARASTDILDSIGIGFHVFDRSRALV